MRERERGRGREVDKLRERVGEMMRGRGLEREGENGGTEKVTGYRGRLKRISRLRIKPAPCDLVPSGMSV